MAMAEKKRIFFVDDEANVLEGLRRSLRAQHERWDMFFFTSPMDALEQMAQMPADCVVSDMQMPQMHGADFLAQVCHLYPDTIRFALSGHTDSANLIRASDVAHQFLSKPCTAQQLIVLIDRACAMRGHLRSSKLIQKLLKIGGIPSAPRAYTEIRRIIQSPDPDIRQVAEAIRKDMGLSTKVLQLTNSAYLGLKHHVSDIVHAASLLGLKHLKPLVLMAEIFEPLNDPRIAKLVNLDEVWFQSLKVAEYAKSIVSDCTDNAPVQEDAFTAGLLHEVGLVVLARQLPDDVVAAYEYAAQKSTSLQEAEKTVFGATHAAIGGYLLELWGLPDPVVEAITFYDLPSALPQTLYSNETSAQITPLTALHLAVYFASNPQDHPGEVPDAVLDTAYLRQVNALENQARWLELCTS